MTKFILMDVGGTISSTSFVHDKLFPYATEHMKSFIKENKEKPEVQKILSTLSAEQGRGLSLSAAAELFNEWIKEAKKHDLLEQILGLIWNMGLESGALKGHVYSEVPGKLKMWKEAGYSLGIYSSAPVETQKLLFKYSEAGDLTPLLCVYFDTQTGPKKEAQSYLDIAKAVGLESAEILFLSDITEELDAAIKAGMQVGQLFRSGVPGKTSHQYTENFDQIELN